MPKQLAEKKISNTFELVILSSVLVAVFFLWDTYFVYPIKLFVVLLHELSHAIAALLTGGIVKEIEIGFDLGGKINAEGGNDLVIASSGYLGSLVIGLILFLAAHKTKYGKYFYYLIGGVVIILLFNTNPGSTFLLLCLLLVATLISLGFFLNNIIVNIISKSISLTSAVYVLIDIKEDVFSRNFLSDAETLSNHTGISSTLIGLGWLFISITLLFVMIKMIYFLQKKKK